MATIEKTLQIAARAHEGQKDKEGLSYILHPLRVMSKVNGEEAQIVAVLHDVIEDTEVTAEQLRQAGFSEKILAAVLCVTHRKEESYTDYVVRCKGNEIARRVKLADLEDNSRLDRTILRPQRFEADVARLRKYVLSYKYLTGQITEQQYRTLMGEVSLRLLVLKSPQVDRLRAFYQALGIDWTEEKHGDGPLHYAGRVGDATLELYPLADDSRSADSATRLGFAVENMAEVVQALKIAGAAIVRESQPTPWGLRAVARDPDGRLVELYQK